MGSDTFEATVADVQSERETRERDLTRRAGNMYRELVGNGMSGERASALVHSVFFTDDPGATMAHVEHTGVFGLWERGIHRWLTDGQGRIVSGPRCVMMAEHRSIVEVAPFYMVAEFGIDGTPILEDTDMLTLSKEGE